MKRWLHKLLLLSIDLFIWKHVKCFPLHKKRKSDFNLFSNAGYIVDNSILMLLHIYSEF